MIKAKTGGGKNNPSQLQMPLPCKRCGFMGGNIGLLVNKVDPDVNTTAIEWIDMMFSAFIFSNWKLS